MNAVLWFWIGTVIGSVVGFGCFCLLLAASDPTEETPQEMMRR